MDGVGLRWLSLLYSNRTAYSLPRTTGSIEEPSVKSESLPPVFTRIPRVFSIPMSENEIV
jgi:hypothetical protein